MQPTTYLWDTPEHARHSARVIMDEEGLTYETMLIGRKVYRTKDVIDACIMEESNYLPRAIGKPNSNGTRDYGLCQYNDGKLNGKYLWIGPGATFATVGEVLSSPEKNVRVMVRTWKAGHAIWWSSYSTGAFIKYLPAPISILPAKSTGSALAGASSPYNELMNTMNPAFVGLIRGLGYPILTLVITYFSTADHITSLGVSASVAVIITAVLNVVDHAIEANTGKAVFGMARTNNFNSR